jgi:phosphoribosylformylglycinamidine cyclo-ligase
MTALSYENAGVSRQAADHFVEKIAVLSRSTLNRRVKASIGGYASLFELDKKNWIAASTDGVGTKLKLAFQLKEHRTVGIDLVAMSVNDLLCVGALPLFFLDYFATGKLDSGVAEDVLAGIVEGCNQAKCALVGGETAEMPDFYSSGEYDLAGFAVGSVHPASVLPKKDIKKGDILIGLASSGFHSNGYSLLRKLISSNESPEVLKNLLAPTRIYVSAIRSLFEKKLVKGMAHITGSGFLNVPRISEKVSYEIHLPPLTERPSVFEWVKDRSGLSLEELSQTFNLGVGMVLVVSPNKSSEALKKLKKSGEKAWVLGEVKARRPGMGSQIFLHEDGNSVTLSY